jgi:hypothetical protein
VFLGNAAMLAGQQPTPTGVGEPIPESAALFQPASSLLSASPLVPAPGSAEPRLDRALLLHALAKDEKRYALIGAVIGAASGTAYYYFAVDSAPENQSNDSWVPSWVGYATFTIPGALLGGLVGASIAYRYSR